MPLCGYTFLFVNMRLFLFHRRGAENAELSPCNLEVILFTFANFASLRLSFKLNRVPPKWMKAHSFLSASTSIDCSSR